MAEELGKAHDMVLKGEELLTTTGKTYYDEMMPATVRRNPEWSTKVKHVLKNSADVLSESTGTLAEGKVWTIGCKSPGLDPIVANWPQPVIVMSLLTSVHCLQAMILL